MTTICITLFSFFIDFFLINSSLQKISKKNIFSFIYIYCSIKFIIKNIIFLNALKNLNIVQVKISKFS